MSSLKNAAPRREHKERSQPLARQRYGLLEKKKDYVKRARDYHSKQDRLRSLREKARQRNPDEFYFGMQRSSIQNGVHVTKERANKYDADTLKLMKTQDVRYAATQSTKEARQIEKLRDNLHLMGHTEAAGKKRSSSSMSDDDDDEDDDSWLNMHDDDNENGGNAKRVKHTVFVSDDEEVDSFDTAAHFDTAPELLKRTFNRPRLSALESDRHTQESAQSLDVDMVREAGVRRERLYKEMHDRIMRKEKLDSTEREMIVQKNLMAKGRRQKIGKDANGLPVYKWFPERRR
ncbi:U3 small nucleolar RNA-associated protein 11 [Ramicandelaber brevisporus]|nr:U3 small nucleolar RNA-associated protein 11 [Ramicandelaber brevisporus]